MIRISCTNCKTILSIDDAFAGGVCRCQHCGTIQTVPAQARGNAQHQHVGVAIGGAKSLYQNGDPNTAGTGLDDLASVVVSSGLSSNRLKQPGPSVNGAGKNLLAPVLIGSGVLLLIIILAGLYWVMHNTAAQSVNNPNGGIGTRADQTTGQGTQTPVTGPAFCGTPLSGNTVVYILDRGQASKNFLGELKDATIKSASSLTADRRFAILFWNDGKEPVAGYPDGTTAYATRESIDAARKAIEDVSSYGQTDVKAAVQQAIALNPDQIIIATGKGIDLNAQWVDDVLTLRGNSKVKIDTYNLISNEGESAPLKRLAEQTGGAYHEMNRAQLASFGE